MDTNKIAELNDKLRRNIFHSGKDKVVLTSGFSALPFDEQLRILIKVKEFKDFIQIRYLHIILSFLIRQVF